MKKDIYTVGTSSRTLQEFIDLLLSYGIQTAVDVRRIPRSKRFPQFMKETLSKALEESGIRYVYLGQELGGLRKKGYKNHALTKTFEEGMEILESLAKTSKTVFFCCERLFFRCHRKFIAKRLKRKGWNVYHIMDFNRIYEERGEYE
ncbi:MAG: DUF488 domain-containing protein [Desulfobacterota bacterium]|nr:DUF488 domain-containing protein [Thermodesulfobacteriota bacterium]MDW8002270.1 DUF488 domain-containing protein [Deltaproteobacteria bacterium]